MSPRTGSLGLVIAVNSSNSRHSEKTENLASSVDFRLIQNLLMLIIFMMLAFQSDLPFFTSHLSPYNKLNSAPKKSPLEILRNALLTFEALKVE